jgi:hypothetical protein
VTKRSGGPQRPRFNRLRDVLVDPVRASKKWVPNMVPIQLVWMEPEDG